MNPFTARRTGSAISRRTQTTFTGIVALLAERVDAVIVVADGTLALFVVRVESSVGGTVTTLALGIEASQTDSTAVLAAHADVGCCVEDIVSLAIAG